MIMIVPEYDIHRCLIVKSHGFIKKKTNVCIICLVNVYWIILLCWCGSWKGQVYDPFYHLKYFCSMAMKCKNIPETSLYYTNWSSIM